MRPSLEWLVMPPEDVVTATAMTKWLADLTAAVEALGEQFATLLNGEGVAGEWHITDGPPEAELRRWGSTADLVILGQSDPDHPSHLQAPEAVVLGCGRPVLLVPYAGSFARVGDNAVIAWNASREAARAAHDALPLFAQAAKVTILSVNPTDEQRRSSERLAQAFSRHGVSANPKAVSAKDLTAAEAVLSHTADDSGDLIVMGAYSHARVREIILGGMTRDMLRSMTVPVLMAH